MPVSSRRNSYEIRIGDKVRVFDREKVMSMMDEDGSVNGITMFSTMMNSICGKMHVVKSVHNNLKTITLSPTGYCVPINIVDIVEPCQ